MPLFGRRRWEPPAPQCVFGIGCSAEKLPPIFDIAHPEGRGGALTGFPLPGDDSGEPGDMRDLERSMELGDVFLIGAPERGLWRVEVHGGGSLPQPPAELWLRPDPPSELIECFVRGRFDVLVQFLNTDARIGPVVLYGSELADRVAQLASGAVQDLHAQRAFAPGEWRVPDRIAEVDAREHLSVHQIGDGGTHWVHTHGLIKFGRPEFEVYGVPGELASGVAVGFLDLAQYVMEGGLIEPGHTLGDPDVPLLARVGEREHDHWWRFQFSSLWVELEAKSRAQRMVFGPGWRGTARAGLAMTEVVGAGESSPGVRP